MHYNSVIILAVMPQVRHYIYSILINTYCIYIRVKILYNVQFVFVSMPPHVPYGLRGLPSRLWPKCNRLLRLGRP
jgi:hypothetical protein